MTIGTVVVDLSHVIGKQALIECMKERRMFMLHNGADILVTYYPAQRRKIAISYEGQQLDVVFECDKQMGNAIKLDLLVCNIVVPGPPKKRIILLQ